MKAVLSTVALAVLLAACSTVNTEKGLRPGDLRSTQYQYVDTDLRMELAAVQRQLFIHREVCEVEASLVKDPRQVHYATVFYAPAGASDLKDQVMLDLTAYSTGKLGIKGYTYYAANKQLAREVVRVLQDPSMCPEGISPNSSPNPYVNMNPVNTAPKKE